MRLGILLFFIGQLGFSQTQVKLTSPKSNQDDYHLVSISDTLYVDITHDEDMGARYGQAYNLKPTAPDGAYEIYVDDTLELKAFIKNHQRDGIWTTFYRDGKLKSTTEYKDGRNEGQLIQYHKTGNISFEGNFVNGKPTNPSTYFYESGKVLAKNYFIDGEYVKQEVFYENGKLKSTTYPKTGIVTKSK